MATRRHVHCHICGCQFDAVRGALPGGTRYVCTGCAEEGFSPRMKQAESLALLSRIYGIPSVDLDDFGAELSLFEQIPESFARHHQLVPVLIVPETREHPRMLVIAMTDPVNSFAVHQLSRQFGLPVQVLAATYEQIVQVIADCYPRLLAGEEPYA